MFLPASRTSLPDVKLQAIISCADDLIVLSDLFSHLLVPFLFLFWQQFSERLLDAAGSYKSFVVFFIFIFSSV